MKRCPQCDQTYDDGTDFCVEDGRPLVSAGNASESRIVVSLDDQESGGEIPTQYVAVPRQNAPQRSAAASPNWLYALTGALAAVVLMGGAYLLFVAPREKGAETTRLENSAPASNVPSSNVTNSQLNNFGANGNSSAPISASNITNAPANAVARPRIKPTNVATTNTNNANSPFESRFRGTYVGTVDNDGIEMQLERNGSSLTGKVRPSRRYPASNLDGAVSDDGTFRMDEKSDIGVVTGVYRGRFNGDGTINGTWSKPGGEKTRPLFLRRR